jgi:hypothetical protein
MAFLAAEPLDFRDGNAGNADVGKGFPDVVEFEGLDNGGDQFHGVSGGGGPPA